MSVIGAEGTRQLVTPHLVAQLSTDQDARLGERKQVPIHGRAIEPGTGHALGELRMTDG
jgi:hypothetical protein